MTNHRLLVVEDDPNICDLITCLAEDLGYEVKAEETMGAIPSFYNNFQPHLIVLDILMPDMDGFEVLHFLHRHTCNSQLIIISARDDYRSMAQQMAQGLGLHVIASLSKPFDIDAMHVLLEQTKGALAA